MLKISAAVCTHNREHLLRHVLQSLADQTLGKECYEIIIVDNASTDCTRDIANEFLGYGNFRYIYEPKPGIAHARSTAYQNARSDYIAYIDDDAKADQNWLSEAVRIIDEIRPDIFGGPYLAFYLDKKPDWFLDKYQSLIQGDKPRFLGNGEWLSGTNIIFRRGLLEKLGGFPTNLGMKEKKISYGEETNIIVRTRNEYPESKIYYDPQLIVYHLVRPNKMSVLWYVKARFQCGRVSDLVFENQSRNSLTAGIISLFKVFYYSVLTLSLVLAGLCFRDRKKYKYPANYMLERGFRYIYVLGHNYQRLVDFTTYAVDVGARFPRPG